MEDNDDRLFNYRIETPFHQTLLLVTVGLHKYWSEAVTSLALASNKFIYCNHSDI